MKKKKYSLAGVDSNAFSIMGYVSKCMRLEGKSEEERAKYHDDAESADYAHLVSVSADMIDELNNK